MRTEVNNNISKIIRENQGEWTSLYTHPKLMGHYFWKDDTIVTRRQRANEVKRVINSKNRIFTRKAFDEELKNQISDPNEISIYDDSVSKAS